METEVSISEELDLEEPRDDRLAITLGALAGALVGGTMVWAYRRAMTRQAQEIGAARPLAAIGVPDVARVVLGILGLLRQVAELGR